MSSMLAERPAAPPSSVPLPTAVRLDGVTKRFGEVTALHEAWLAVAPGEFVTLLGPSGCGKTTLLNLIAGFLEPDRGEIVIAGERVTEVPTFQRGIGMVFQNYALFPHMSVAGNVAYGLKMRRVPKAEIARRVEEMLALVRLEGYGDRRPRQLSGGQQQRVALARALVIRPKVLLLDEPFSALDKNLRASMQVELREIQRRLGVTTVFVTHDQGEALSLSDRIAVMSEGHIRQIGTPDEIYRRPRDRFVASFVGDVSVLKARLDGIDAKVAAVSVGASRLALPPGTLEGVRPGADLELFVRPEQLRLLPVGEGAGDATVSAAIYQGSHTDLYLDSPLAASGRLLARLPGFDGAGRWPAGSKVGIAVSGSDAVAFPS
jgi:spermidine/putrescine ABC transporter ATP-binding subunit